MKIYKYIPGEAIPEKTAIALGFFDGVHEGHRKLLSTAKRISKEKGLTFAVFTFRTVCGIKGNTIIYSDDEKLSLFEDIGVESVILLDFSDISDISADSFIKECLFRDMGCRVAVCGYDFRFGKGRVGDAKLLFDILSSLGAECIIEDEHKIDGEKISTTKIKELLEVGEVGQARLFLGYPYFMLGDVERGRGVGQKLGFPTVNTTLSPERAPLRRGVYRTAVSISGKLYTGVTNVGTCPTFKERAVHAETYIVGYSGDLYGEKIKIFFLGFLRDEKKFSSPEELIMQINVDKNRAIKENGELTWQEIGLN